MSCADAVLDELSRHPEGLSLPRLCKRLGLRMSVLLRELAWLGADPIGGTPGPDLVRVEQRGDLVIAMLTETGRRQLQGGAPSRDRHATRQDREPE
jgi:hypothetical protein